MSENWFWSLGSMLSFYSGVFLLIASVMVVVEYWPKERPNFRDMPAPTMLQFGIFLGFVFIASNTFWWQFLNTLVVQNGWLTRLEFQQIGKFMDVPLKGGSGVVALIHLRAKRKMRQAYDPRT